MDVMQVYEELRERFGPQAWWPVHRGRKRPGFDPVFEVLAGAILTQNTAWKNVEPAIDALYHAGCLDARAITHMRLSALRRCIRSAGYYNQKALKLRILARFIMDNYRGSARRMATSIARDELLALWGIGPETADSMLCYAGKRQEFVIDVYTKRLCAQYGVRFQQYDEYKKFFEEHVTQEYDVYNEYHALIVAWGKSR